MKTYRHRQDAGLQLAKILAKLDFPSDTHVFALPRGGVPVAYEIAKQLNFSLDVLVVRKIGLPHRKEYAVGAIGPRDVLVMNPLIPASLDVQAVIAAEKQELRRRELVYRGSKPYPNLDGKTAIIVDDGIATGYTMQAALLFLKALNPKKIILAVPVSSSEAIQELNPLVDVVVCPYVPEDFYAVGSYYDEFLQVSDAEVLRYLEQ